MTETERMGQHTSFLLFTAMEPYSDRFLPEKVASNGTVARHFVHRKSCLATRPEEETWRDERSLL